MGSLRSAQDDWDNMSEDLEYPSDEELEEEEDEAE
jgi:hypothetical protein